jgi:hypothetical protein
MADNDIDALFAAPLADFVAERKRIAQALKDAGRRDDAKAIAGTPKPTLPIWIVNQLARREPELVTELDELTARLRGAEGPDYASTAVNHRRVLAELRWKAEEILTGAGHPAPPAVLNRVIANLRAAATGAESRALLVAGRLTRDVEEPGFADLFGQAATQPATAARAAAPKPTRADDARHKREHAANAREQAAAARAEQRARAKALATAERQTKQLRAADTAARGALAREERTRDAAREVLARAEKRVEAARVAADATAGELAAADAEVTRLRESK